MVAEVQTYVPGYRLKQEVQFEHIGDRTSPAHPRKWTALHRPQGRVFLEVEGRPTTCPAYAGNLDIMTSAALRTGEKRSRAMAAAAPRGPAA
jgi:acetaldehyde dehydrogenase